MTLEIKGVKYLVSDEATGTSFMLLLKAAKMLEGMANTTTLSSVKSPLMAASIAEGPGVKEVGLLLENGSWVWIKN